MKTFFKTILIRMLFTPCLSQAQEMSIETAQKKFDAIQIKGKGMFKLIGI